MKTGPNVDANALIQKGWELCFDEACGDPIEGRKLLQKALRAGRDDALLLLGKSFESEGDFDSAEETYLKVFENKKKLRSVIFRLALLHGRALVKEPDQQFFLVTIRKLAAEGHFPSIAIYTNERMKGSYGWAHRFFGYLAVVPNVIRFVYRYSVEPESHRFEQ